MSATFSSFFKVFSNEMFVNKYKKERRMHTDNGKLVKSKKCRFLYIKNNIFMNSLSTTLAATWVAITYEMETGNFFVTFIILREKYFVIRI